jgi:hypothetical protein
MLNAVAPKINPFVMLTKILPRNKLDLYHNDWGHDIQDKNTRYNGSHNKDTKDNDEL